MKRLAVTAVAGSLVLGLVGCGSSSKKGASAGNVTTAVGSNTTAAAPATTAPASTTAAGPPIKVAVILDLSGPTAQSASDHRKGIELAVKQTNDAGGINGRPIEATYSDDAANPAQDQAIYLREVVDGGAVAVLGPNLSSSAKALLQQMTRSNKSVPAIGVAADPSLLGGGDAKWYFGSGLNVTLSAQGLVDALHKYDTSPNQVWGSIYSDVASAKTSMNTAKDHATSLGLKWAGEQPVGTAQTDLFAPMSSLKDAGVTDLVQLLLSNPATVNGFLRAKSQLSWNVNWVTTDIALALVYGTVDNSLLEGGIVENICNPASNGFKQMLAEYQKVNGTAASITAYDSIGTMYNGSLLLFEALKQVKDPNDSSALQSAITHLSNFTSYCSGKPVTFSDTDHSAHKEYTYSRLVNGQKQVLSG
jgi:branched-chain amino acid transport system substrate-binding protein